MQKLYESILSSTDTGRYHIIKEKIVKWSDKYLTYLNGKKLVDVKIELDKNDAILITSSPYTDYIICPEKGWENMPKELKSIFFATKSPGKDIYTLENTFLLFPNINNTTIDFSKIDIIKGLKALKERIDQYGFRFTGCKDISIENLSIPSNNLIEAVRIEVGYGYDIKLKNINVPSAYISIDESNMNIEDIKGCNIKALRFSESNIKGFGCRLIEKDPYNPVYKLSKKNSEAIDNLIASNNIEKIDFYLYGNRSIPNTKLYLKKQGDVYIFSNKEK